MALYKEKNQTLIFGDCLKVMNRIEDNSIDMVLCDLPYGTTQNNWDEIICLESLWRQYWRICKPNSAVVLTAQCPFDKTLGMSQIKYLKYEWIWKKEAGTGHLNAKRMPLKNCENVLVFYKKQPIYNPQMRKNLKPYVIKQGRASTNYGAVKPEITTENKGDRYPLQILEFKRDKHKLHPTQKPVALFEYLIKTYTNKGQTILDNCSGSGTTAIAAVNTERKSICIESNLDHYMKSIERLKSIT